TSGDDLARLTELISVFRSNRNFASILVSDPFKQEFCNLVDEITPLAARCGAINIVYKRGQSIIGDNCDGKAFLMGAQSAHSFDFGDRRVLFFGCGGVSSAVAVVLSDTVQTIGLLDPSTERMRSLASNLHELNPRLQIELFDADCRRNFVNFD